MIAEKGHGDGYTLGNTKQYSIIEIAEAFGGPVEYVEGNPGRSESGEAPSRAREELGWDTTLDILDYIKDFVRTHTR